MFSFRTCQVMALGAFLLAAPAFASRTHRAATSGHSHAKSKKHTHAVVGQRGIDPDRAREIQDALIREHYLTAPASGQWDSNTEAAMQKFQADHGWQTRLTPDSRALIKLGLGPASDGTQTAAAAPAAAPVPAASTTSVARSNTLADTRSIQN